MNKLTFELLNTEDFILEFDRNDRRIPAHEWHEQRVSEAWEYAGLFSPFEVAEVFCLPVTTVRRIEQEKQTYYRGR